VYKTRLILFEKNNTPYINTSLKQRYL